ncbi:MAG: excinuclease ABC subunit UvrA [Armatimonadaceae bacterium]
MRETIYIRGARENNLKNIDVEIPRDKLIVLTGLSGSGKSSLAFDTLYAEAQRRFLESLSAWTRRFVQQQRKPAVDAIYGLSPVISIEQKTITKNPRSTVGTMTDIGDYLRLLFATTGTAHCRLCDREIPIRSVHQMAEHVLALPQGTEVEVCAPLEKVYDEDWDVLFQHVRTQGCRRVRLDGELVDLADGVSLSEEATPTLEAVVDRLIVKQTIEKPLLAAIEHAIKIGEGFVRFRMDNPEAEKVFYREFGCPEHHLIMGEVGSWYFSFNEPESACVTCSGLGTYLRVHTGLLVPDPSRSIIGGAFVPEGIKFDKNTGDGRTLYSLSQQFGFSLETPFQDLPPEIQDLLFYGAKGKEFTLLQVPGGADHRSVGKPFKFDGVVNRIERHYRWYRQKQTASGDMEDYLRKVMVEHTCPDCQGTRLKRSRLRVLLGGKNIYEVGQMTLEDAHSFLSALPVSRRNPGAGDQIGKELTERLKLLVDIGLDYLSINRRSATLSGGESQRIRLSTQIASELMGMLYVLDEPSIGLHPKDNEKLISTMRRLRDIGNTVIVIEHDVDTMRAADYVLEVGPGPGVHGGTIVAQGTLDAICENPDSLTGAFLTGRATIPVPEKRRAIGKEKLTVRGARENNLKNVTVDIPLGGLICITGASGSGKSTLINDIVFKKLWSLKHDSRVLSGEHDELEGADQIGGVIEIDQAPIGRSPRSNPATYIGFYDDIRKLFAETEAATEREYTPSRFSFNVKGGRCEECSGEGTITTQLNFMPDVESVCPTCKGNRYNADTLEVTWCGKNIAEVLEMSVEEAVPFFEGQRRIASRLKMLHDLGLGYLTLGQASTTLSGGEAQRVKLAGELSKVKRGAKNIYILDEPTTGLHLADIQKLLDCINRLVDAGNTVLVIEHHLDVIKCADWVIDLGPDGGKRGGEVVVAGTPETVAACPSSYTGHFLKDVLA